MNRIGKVITVRGPVFPEELGITLPHEHILLDQSLYLPAAHPSEYSFDAPLSPETIPLVKRDPYTLRDNMVMQEVALAAKELGYFAERGGKSVVDMTNIGWGRNHEGLKEISEATGLHIVASTGFYVEPAHPSFVKEARIEELTSRMVKELTEGIDGTEVRAGMIGEIGTSAELTEQEEKVLRAAGRAQVQTGGPMNVHLATMKGREGPKVLDILDEEGVDLNCVVLSHMDFVFNDVEHQEELARRGAFLEFDSFGEECTFESKDFTPPRDLDKVKGLKRLIDDGFGEQLLISQDICFKILLKAFGGQGYDHILRNILPMMRKAGIGDEVIRQLMEENPARLLAF